MWNKLSFIAYLASLTTLLVMLFRFNPFGLSGFALVLGVFTFGLTGFIFSILSNYFDPDKKQKKNKVQTLVFYIGMIVVFTGIMTHIMHWPFTVDRKSTRLNSSHVRISYAVFCLKKKKKKK